MSQIHWMLEPQPDQTLCIFASELMLSMYYHSPSAASSMHGIDLIVLQGGSCFALFGIFGILIALTNPDI